MEQKIKYYEKANRQLYVTVRLDQILFADQRPTME